MPRRLNCYQGFVANKLGVEQMFGFSVADWIFIGLVMGVIFLCVALSGMNKRKN